MSSRRGLLTIGPIVVATARTTDPPAIHSWYLRVTQTSTAASWWTVADLRVYG